jgi:hypothetical protein
MTPWVRGLPVIKEPENEGVTHIDARTCSADSHDSCPAVLAKLMGHLFVAKFVTDKRPFTFDDFWRLVQQQPEIGLLEAYAAAASHRRFDLRHLDLEDECTATAVATILLCIRHLVNEIPSWYCSASPCDQRKVNQELAE